MRFSKVVIYYWYGRPSEVARFKHNEEVITNDYLWIVDECIADGWSVMIKPSSQNNNLVTIFLDRGSLAFRTR